MQRFYLIMPIQLGWNFRKGQGSPRGFPLGSRATIMPARTRLRLFRRRAWAAISGQAAHGPPAANATLLMRTRTVLGERSMSRARSRDRSDLCDARLDSQGCSTTHTAKAGLFGPASLVALSSRSSVQELFDFLQTCSKSPAQYDPAVGVDEHVTAAVVGVRQMLPLS